MYQILKGTLVGLLVVLSASYCSAQEDWSGADAATVAKGASGAGQAGESDGQMPHGRRQGGGGPLRRVMQLPSLTPKQRQQIAAILGSYRKEMQELRSEIQSLKARAREDANIGGEIHERARALKQQAREKTQVAWQKVRSLLTKEQLQELQKGGGAGKPAPPQALQG